jgi:hypothetical protein
MSTKSQASGSARAPTGPVATTGPVGLFVVDLTRLGLSLPDAQLIESAIQSTVVIELAKLNPGLGGPGGGVGPVFGFYAS